MHILGQNSFIENIAIITEEPVTEFDYLIPSTFNSQFSTALRIPLPFDIRISHNVYTICGLFRNVCKSPQFSIHSFIHQTQRYTIVAHTWLPIATLPDYAMFIES